MEKEQIKAEAKSGFRWSFLRQAIMQVLNLTFTVLLARLLLPSDFGDLALAMIFVGIFGVFRGVGLNKAFIFEREVDDSVFSSAFWASILSGLLLAGLILLLSLPYGGYLAKGVAFSAVVYWLALDFFLASWHNLPYAKLIRDLNFKRIFWMDTTITLISGVVAIVLAINGWGIWALVARTMTSTVLKLFLLNDLIRVSFANAPSWSHLQQMFDFSIPTIGHDLLQFLKRNFDDFLIGKVLGEHALGLYNRSYALLLLPVRQVSTIFSPVLFPVLARLEEDKDLSVSIYTKVLRTIAFVTFPAMTGCWILRQSLVLAVLGESWAGMIPIIGVFSLLGALQSISALNGNVFLAKGATGLQLRLGLITKLFVIACMFIGIQYGLMGITWAYTIASLIISVPEFHYTSRLLETSTYDLLKGPAKSFCASILMGAAVYVVDQFGPGTALSYWGRLFVGSAIGLSCYISIQYLLFRGELVNFLNIVREQLLRVKKS